MGKKRRGLVETQKLKEINGSGNSYENYNEDAENLEATLANPDLLPEQSTSPSTPQLIMGEAVEHLQGRQKQVYMSVMREDKSLSEVGEMLDITKSSAQTYLDRAIAFITAYCKQAEARGRI